MYNFFKASLFLKIQIYKSNFQNTRDTRDMARHVRWGGHQIHHVFSEQEDIEDGDNHRGVSLLGPGDSITRNTKLHR